MDNKHLMLNANPIVTALQKPAAEFTKADIIQYIVDNEIRMVNFMYPGGDGKLKTLNFVINDLDYLETILTCGERVDGSSLFSFIQAGSSVDALFLFRQGRPSAGVVARAYAAQGCRGLQGSDGHGVPGDGRTGVLRDQR